MESDLDRIPSEEWIALALKAKFKPKALADCCKISLRQMQRYFKGAFLQSPKIWLHALRMSIARQMTMQLRTEKEIASILAFSNVSHFVREFKRFFGRSPKEYLRTETLRTPTQRNVSPESRALEAQYLSAAVHPRDQHTLLCAHQARIRKRLAR